MMKEELDTVKVAFDLLKQVLIVIAIGLVLIFPSQINRILSEAGIETVNAAGFQLRVLKSNEAQLANVQEKVAKLVRDLTESGSRISQALGQISATVDSNVREKIEQAKLLNQQAITRVKTIESGIDQSLLANDAALAQLNAAATASGSWGVIYGSFPTLDVAIIVANSARGSGVAATTKIYLKRERYRTVALFASKADAVAEVSGIEAKVKSGAYAVDLSSWCPTSHIDNGAIICD